MSESIRPCPLCDGTAAGVAFPFAVQFAAKRFDYLKCGRCDSVFVNPVPDDQAFAAMYAKAEYHDCHYAACNTAAYTSAAKLLGAMAPVGATVLDYGCGAGYFLQVVKQEGFMPCGVEFDEEAAKLAAQKVGCDVFTVEEFAWQSVKLEFDVIHLGDVLEHLPDPALTLRSLLNNLRLGGLIFVEGPLEINPSPVYWAARLFGTLKHVFRPDFVGQGKPTHLFRTGARQQQEFFTIVEPSLELCHWCVYETGWPYSNGGFIKRIIAKCATLLGGRTFGKTTFGNRFSAIYVKP